MAKFFQVGGCVRDKLLGRESKDIDFSVEAESFDAMRQAILDRGCKIFLESPQFFTIRARDPKFGAVDFVLCRKDGEYIDGRRPESVEMGSLHDDLSRRDFTMNAIAEDEDGNLIDPFVGQDAIDRRIIRCVGWVEDRFGEDGLRILRALRFSVVLGFALDGDIHRFLLNATVHKYLAGVSVERVREELNKMFKANTLESLCLLEKYPKVRDAIFQGDLKLMSTLKKEF
jgi:tRNA nucleotidyltransferase (CCA-adding enzyme)